MLSDSRNMSLLNPRAIVITTTNNRSRKAVNSAIVMEDFDEDMTDSGEPRKRRRLSHLTPDEKFLRRKLKNRVAAQTARDRKKAQMSDMEITICKLEAENKKLQEENLSLKVHSDTLVIENNELKQRLGQCNYDKTDLATSDKMETKSTGSAASAVPLPKEQISIPLRWMKQYKACVVILSTMLALVYFNKVNKPLTTVSRKRKQPYPSRLLRIKTEPTVPNQLGAVQWWGPHQQSWNPSMN